MDMECWAFLGGGGTGRHVVEDVRHTSHGLRGSRRGKSHRGGAGIWFSRLVPRRLDGGDTAAAGGRQPGIWFLEIVPLTRLDGGDAAGSGRG